MERARSRGGFHEGPLQRESPHLGEGRSQAPTVKSVRSALSINKTQARKNPREGFFSGRCSGCASTWACAEKLPRRCGADLHEMKGPVQRFFRTGPVFIPLCALR